MSACASVGCTQMSYESKEKIMKGTKRFTKRLAEKNNVTEKMNSKSKPSNWIVKIFKGLMSNAEAQ